MERVRQIGKPGSLDIRKQPLSPNARAVIRNKKVSATGSTLFHVELGTVVHYPVSDSLSFDDATKYAKNDIGEGSIDRYIAIGTGSNRGILGLKPLDRYRTIVMSVPIDRREDVRLILYDRSLQASEDPLRVDVVGRDTLAQLGFDFDMSNNDMSGYIFPPQLAQFLYDFQIEQGDFAKETSER